jgi:hypothetical protein
VTTVTADFPSAVECLTLAASDSFATGVLDTGDGTGLSAGTGSELGTPPAWPALSLEIGSNLRIDAFPPVETAAANVSTDRMTWLEILSGTGPSPNLQVDSWLPFEALVSSRTRDSWVAAELLAAQRVDPPAEIEAAAFVVPPPVELEFLAGVRADPLPPAELQAPARADFWPLAEATSSIPADRWPAIEALATRRIDPPAPAEAQGAPGLVAISIAPVEALLSVLSDDALIELVALFRSDAAGTAEWIATQRHGKLPVEWAALFHADIWTAAESNAYTAPPVTSDQWLPFEVLAARFTDEGVVAFEGLASSGTRQGADFVLAIGLAANFLADARGVAEWIARSVSDRWPALEPVRGMLVDPVANAPAPIEFGALDPPPMLFVAQGRVRASSAALQRPRAFDPIAPGVTDNFAFDFSALVGTASIISVSWTCSPLFSLFATSVDTAPQMHVLNEAPPQSRIVTDAVQYFSNRQQPGSGLASVTAIGAFAVATIGGFTAGQQGTLYDLAATVTTSDGRTLTLSADLPIEP